MFVHIYIYARYAIIQVSFLINTTAFLRFDCVGPLFGVGGGNVVHEEPEFGSIWASSAYFHCRAIGGEKRKNKGDYAAVTCLTLALPCFTIPTLLI